MPTHYIYLAVAIISEVIATTSLKAAENFTRPLPSVITVVGYIITFWFLSLALKTMPTGIAYAIWSGVGIVLITVLSWILFKQSLDLPALIGMGLIILGVIVINLFSTSVSH
jgi:small multidrug resistance pump